jgi:hypothetical protein
MLFRGIDSDPDSVDFTPVIDMAAEYFTNIGIACSKCTMVVMTRNPLNQELTRRKRMNSDES